ncbi:ABC transporter ATP-binding protein [Methylomagnum ishizawai]|uniref:ABC transporter ATP-binding protein n=1 Tax=Methylomagnum ishizawai TaxID=1760988 RepID=UPI001C3284D4|nr:ABC transporter ATP-binding protein [Methylomagnum ishizawai]BBL77329.1 HlyB/MsbA family ABC transporter [Methylomagnum ishizawai]
MAFRNVFSGELDTFRALLPLLAPYRWAVAGFVVLGLLASLLEGLGIGLMIPLLQGYAVPAGNGGGPLLDGLERLAAAFPAESRSATLMGLVFAAILVKIVLAYLFTGLAAWIRSRVVYDLRIRMYRQILALSQAYLDAAPTGTLLQTLTTNAAETAYSATCLLWLALNISAVLVFALLLAAIAWKTTLAVLAVLLLLSKLVRAALGGVKALGQRNLGLYNEISHLIKETLAGLRTIHAFGRETYELGRFEAAHLASHRLEFKQERMVALAHPLSEGLAAMVLMGLVILALRTGLSLPILATLVFMLLRLLPHIQSANTQITVILSRSAAVCSVLDLLDGRGKLYPKAGSARFGGFRRDIHFERVCFGYQGKEQPALQDIDLRIGRDQTVALVGPSGAGKSTLIHMLCRFYEPSGGRILVDGRDLAEFDLASWRERIALVGQDVHIFNATVRDNIAYGRLEAGPADIVAAARRAHAHNFIADLPQGYDTLLGDRGVLLSGGQRQRISIARAILRDPDILILDEATNALDAVSETHIQAAIEALGRSRTVLVVAHRLSTIERADRIVVLDQGRVAEQGRFDELLERGGLFATLYRGHRLGLVEPAAEVSA